MKLARFGCATYFVVVASTLGEMPAARAETANAADSAPPPTASSAPALPPPPGAPGPSASAPTPGPAPPPQPAKATIAVPAEASATSDSPAPAAANAPAPSFLSDPIGEVANAVDLTLKMYGDTGFAVRNNAFLPWTTATANPNVYSPGVWNSFYAPRLDVFGSADAGKLSFLTEVMFDAFSNNFSVDIERMQIAYLFENWLRIRAGRSHLAWGYYNDTYHHGNLFELTTSRPFSANFEDSFGIVLSHIVGVGVDGTFDVHGAGSIRYDAELGNGRGADITSVSMQYAEKNDKAVNVRLRWLPVDGLIIGINAMRDTVPMLGAQIMGGGSRPTTEELVGGVHVVYTENHVIADVEGFGMRHNPDGADSTNIWGGFAEFGYSIGPFTPYVRGEYIRFPLGGDIIYQYSADSAQGTLVSGASIYSGARDFTDFRLGVKWMPIPQIALKLEGERLARDAQDQEIATVKAAFGF